MGTVASNANADGGEASAAVDASSAVTVTAEDASDVADAGALTGAIVRDDSAPELGAVANALGAEGAAEEAEGEEEGAFAAQATTIVLAATTTATPRA